MRAVGPCQTKGMFPLSPGWDTVGSARNERSWQHRLDQQQPPRTAAGSRPLAVIPVPLLVLFQERSYDERF